MRFSSIVAGLALALAVADFGYVMEAGEIRLQGSVAELEADPGVQQAYLRT